MGIIESTKQLDADIQACISNLIKARTTKNKDLEFECYQQIEYLLVCTSQQLQCLIDYIEEL